MVRTISAVLSQRPPDAIVWVDPNCIQVFNYRAKSTTIKFKVIGSCHARFKWTESRRWQFFLKTKCNSLSKNSRDFKRSNFDFKKNYVSGRHCGKWLFQFYVRNITMQLIKKIVNCEYPCIFSSWTIPLHFHLILLNSFMVCLYFTLTIRSAYTFDFCLSYNFPWQQNN